MSGCSIGLLTKRQKFIRTLNKRMEQVNSPLGHFDF